MNRTYVIIGVAVAVVTILLSLFVYWYRSLDDSEEDDSSASGPAPAPAPESGPTPAPTPPHVCTIFDIAENMGLIDNFSQRNGQIVRELMNTADDLIATVSRKPIVRSVMEGMDANMDMLLDGVNRDFVIAFMLAWYRCGQSDALSSDEFGQTLLENECLLSNFNNDRESLAEDIARVINTVRDNATRYEDRFVFRNTNIDIHDMVSVRDNMLRKWIQFFQSLPSVTKEDILNMPPPDATQPPPDATQPPPDATQPPPPMTPRPTTVGELLVARGWRTQDWVTYNSPENHRNTLIVILNNITKTNPTVLEKTIPMLQSMTNDQLMSVVVVLDATQHPPPMTPRPTTVGELLVERGLRSQDWVTRNSPENHRNTLVVILNNITKTNPIVREMTIPMLQSMTSDQLMSVVVLLDATQMPRPTTVGELLVARGWRHPDWVTRNSPENHRNELAVVLNMITKTNPIAQEMTIPMLQSMTNDQLMSVVVVLNGNY